MANTIYTIAGVMIALSTIYILYVFVGAWVWVLWGDTFLPGLEQVSFGIILSALAIVASLGAIGTVDE